MPFAVPVNPYAEYDPRESYVTVRECAEILNMSREQVIELANQGTLRTRWGLVQPAAIPGFTI
jgi:hypothetical protein